MAGPCALTRGVASWHRRSVVACAALAALLAVSACRKRPDGLTSQRPGTIEGRVLGADLPADTPIELKVLRPGGAVAAGTNVSAGAPFRLPNIPAGEYQLTAEAPGLGTAALLLQLQPGETLRTVLRLKEPARVEGHVVDRRGKPVPGALVLVWRSGQEPHQARQATTNEEGRFEITRLAAPAVAVFVQAPGIGSVKLDHVALPARLLNVALEGEGRTLGGQVDGARGGAEIQVRLGGAGVAGMRSARVDHLGRFVFHGLGTGEYSVRAAGVAQASPTKTVQIEQADVMDVQLPLESGEVITGRVVNGEGKALSGAQVAVQAIPPDGCPEIVTTDVVGYFSTAALARGRYQVVARLPGFVPPPPETVAINARPAPLTVRLFRAGRIVGRLRLPDGRPATDAEVVLLSPAQPRFPRDRVPVVPGSLPMAAEAAALGTQALPHVVGSRAATTGEGGAFSLSDLRPGSYGLRITHPESATLEIPARALNEGAQLDFGALSLPLATAPSPAPSITPALPPGDRRVEGQVRDPRGRGLAEVALTARPLDPRAVPVSSATSAASGAFALERLPAVPLIVRAQHKSFGVISRELGPEEKSLNLKFPNPGGLEGEIVDPNGRFLSGGAVSLIGPEGLAGPPVQMAGAGFRVLGVPPGTWIVKASVPGFDPAETKVEVPSGPSSREPTVKGVRLQVRPNR